MTGGGFGGCLVALVHPGASVDGWAVTAVDGAHVVHSESAIQPEP
jgi:galactokinase